MQATNWEMLISHSPALSPSSPQRLLNFTNQEKHSIRTVSFATKFFLYSLIPLST